MSQDYKSNRHIRVFISSTFKRMEGEREMLINKTFPVLRRMAQERDVVLTDVDLRWGITQEESQSGKVVEICLKEIENSIPFFIGIIGERYGWVPKEGDIPESTLDKFGRVNDYLKRELSVTEMEMQFGVLERSENMNAYFFIKEGDGLDPEESKVFHDKLSDLKTAVINNLRYPISSYSSSEDLADQVEQCFRALIDRLFPEKANKEEREDTFQSSIVNRLCYCYVQPSENMDRLDGFVHNTTDNVLLVQGEPGGGKSSLLANWYENRKETYKVFYHNLAFSGQAEPGITMVRRLSRILSSYYHIPLKEGANYETATEFLSEIITQIDKLSEPTVIVLDSLEIVSQSHLAQCLSWIPMTLNSVKIICSATSGSHACSFLLDRSYQSMTVSSLTVAQREEMISLHLQKYHSKHLSQDLTSRLADSKVAEKPAVLSSMLNELANFGVHEKIDSFISKQLIVENELEFYTCYLQRLEILFGFDHVSSIFSTILSTKSGIPESVLLEYTGCSRLILSQLLGYVGDSVSSVNGLLHMANSSMAESASDRYLSRDDVSKEISNRLISFLKGREDYWSVLEMAYQLHTSERWGELAEFLMAPEHLDTLYRKDYDGLFFQICDLVKEDGFSLSAYEKVLDSYSDSPIYADVVMELFNLSILISENPSIDSFSDRIDKAMDGDANKISREEWVAKRAVYYEITKIYQGCNWHFKRVSKFAEKALPFCNSNVPFEKEDCLNLLAIGQAKTLKYKNAIKNIETIIESAKAFNVEERQKFSHLGSYYHTLGQLYMFSYDNQLEKYYKYNKLSFEYYIKAYGKDSPQMIIPYINIAEATVYNKPKDAIDFYKKAEQLCIFFYGEESPQMEECLSRLINILYIAKDYQGMKDVIEKAIPLFQTLPKNLHTFNSLNVLNNLLWMSKDDSVRENLSRAEVTLKRQFSGPNPSLAFSLHDLGDTYKYQGKYKEAEECYNEALEIFLNKYKSQEKNPLNHPVMWCYDGLWVCYYNSDDFEKSYEVSIKAIEYATAHGMNDDEHCLEKELGLSAWKTDRKQEAIDNLSIFYNSKHNKETKQSNHYKVILQAMKDLGLM